MVKLLCNIIFNFFNLCLSQYSLAFTIIIVNIKDVKFVKLNNILNERNAAKGKLKKS